jgi:hypothetical protein
MQFSPLFHHLTHLQHNILSTLFSNALCICSSLNDTNQVSHLYRTTDKIIVLYILILSS